MIEEKASEYAHKKAKEMANSDEAWDSVTFRGDQLFKAVYEAYVAGWDLAQKATEEPPGKLPANLH